MPGLLTLPHLTVWILAALVMAGMMIRPFGWPEMTWAVAAAIILVGFGLMPLGQAWQAVNQGNDVYLFLTGMLLLSECCRSEGLFDWLALVATRNARGSGNRLFLLVYGVGTLVTIFLSNDATAVVLTPAVYAATKAAGAKPLPYLYICAFIANAASFVLPISNPANLVVFGHDMPSLFEWLGRFFIPSVAAIGITLIVLWFSQRRQLNEGLNRHADRPPLSGTGKISAAGIALTGFTLLTASAFKLDLGAPTFICGVLTATLIWMRKSENPVRMLREISWQVLPLVAALFILVEAVNRTGVLQPLSRFLQALVSQSAMLGSLLVGACVAVLCNFVNNLPLGLVAGTVVSTAHLPTVTASSILIGVDLAPNLSVTGSLATILWILALRREGQHVTAWQFLKLGLLVMPPALLGALLLCVGLSTS